MSEYLPGTFEPVGAPVVNLFTNPNFVAGSGTVEVQRNYAISSTGASTAADWRGTGNSTGRAISVVPGAGPGGRDCWQFESGASGGGWFQKPAVDGMAVTPGQVVSLSVALRGVAGSTIEVNITGVQSGSEAILVTKNVKITDSWARYAWEGYTVPANVSYVALGIRSASPSTFPLTWFVGDIQYEPSPTARSFIYGGGGFPDPDLPASWAGTPNASPSILTGVPVAGVPSILDRCLAIHSTKYGGSMRLIAARSTNDTFVAVPVPQAAWGGGTIVGTRHQEAVITNPINRVLWAGLPDQQIPFVNEVGSREYRLSFTGLTSVRTFRFYHGGAQGSGDVYWTLGGLFAGDYDGPAFSGATRDTEQFVYDWLDTPNASPSTRQEMEAVMATIYGTLTDFGLQSLAPYKPVLRFTPSGPGVRGQRLFSARPVEAPVTSSGAFAVLLEPTDGVFPDVWYTVSIEYLNPGGQYTSYDLLGYRLKVSGPGGAIGELPQVPISPDTVLVSLAPPPEGYKGWYLNAPGPDQDPGDPDDPASSGTGILEIVS